jgi:hypothetical protein
MPTGNPQKTHLYTGFAYRNLILIILANLNSLLVLHVSRLTFDINRRKHVTGRGTEQGCTQPRLPTYLLFTVHIRGL